MLIRKASGTWGSDQCSSREVVVLMSTSVFRTVTTWAKDAARRATTRRCPTLLALKKGGVHSYSARIMAFIETTLLALLYLGFDL